MAHQFAKSQIYAYSIILIFSFFSLNSFAQSDLTTKSAKAEKFYLKAEESFFSRDYASTKENIEKAIEADNQFIEAYLLLAEMSIEVNQIDDAIYAYEKALSIDSLFFVSTSLTLAQLYNDKDNFESAIKLLEWFLKCERTTGILSIRAKELYDISVFRDHAIKNPVKFNAINAGDSINSTADEYINALQLNGEMLLFTRRFVDSSRDNPGYLNEQFFYSTLVDKTWSKAEKLKLSWTNQEQIGAMAISADGLKLYFAACGWQYGNGSCDLYVSEYKDDKWNEPINLKGLINSNSWDSQPSVSADGKELYFASKRSGGAGGSDIWMSTLKEDGFSWSQPKNLEEINTEGNEMAPFIHPDGKTMYFSSDGHIGMGGLDLFVSRRDENGKWQKAVNLGYPLNTKGNEIIMVVEANGKNAWISAEKNGGFGHFDIYKFELDDTFQAEPVTYIKGFVYEKGSNKPLSASIQFADPLTGDILLNYNSSEADGAFFAVLPSRTSYSLEVGKTSYLFYQEAVFPTENSEIEPFKLNVYLEPIAVGSTVLLKNIHFEFNSSVLSETSKAGILMLKTFLENSPKMVVELAGHTDDSGDKAFNLKLSHERAKVVRNELIKMGIAAERLVAKGYGETQPLVPNTSEENRAMNRRTEMKVLK